MRRAKMTVTYELIASLFPHSEFPEVSIEAIEVDSDTRTLQIYLAAPDDSKANLFHCAEGTPVRRITEISVRTAKGSTTDLLEDPEDRRRRTM